MGGVCGERVDGRRRRKWWKVVVEVVVVVEEEEVEQGTCRQRIMLLWRAGRT